MKHFFLPLSLFILFLSCNSFLNEQDLDELVLVTVDSAKHQCIIPDYTSLADAVQFLESNDIPVFDSQTWYYITCAACSCKTGITYAASIKEVHVEKAISLGWQPGDEGDDTIE